MHPDLVPEILLPAYASGIFPMADENGELFWLAPDPRAIIPLDGFNVSRSLRSTVRRNVFEITVNRAFDRVLDTCAERKEGTWISQEIKEAYAALHGMGFAHSVEAWKGDELVGGLYGVAVGGAFFGESMFRREPDASKVAMVHLVERLRDRGFTLLDVQFINDHLRSFGAIEIPKAEYDRRLKDAIAAKTGFADDSPRSFTRRDDTDN